MEETMTKIHIKRRRRKAHLVVLAMALFLTPTSGQHQPNYNNAGSNQIDLWQTERPADMANIADLEVMCGKDHMEVQITFDRPFNGIVFSKGAVDRYNCIYVKPQTGLSQYKFDIMYDSCGSKPDLNGKFYENNIVIQYDKDLIEVWDEAKRLRCEWYNDYEKGVTKPPIRVSDLDVVELNFRGDNVDCWMEIQQGKGPWASPVKGIVPLGTTLTMVVGIDDKQGEFDMRVKSCEASDDKNRPIQLSDENGCVLRPKMISKFMKMRSTDPRATVVTYAFFHAFKFPDSMAVQIRCKVEICRFGCPDHCQSPGSYNAREQEVSTSINQGYSPQQSAPAPVVHKSEPKPSVDQYSAPQKSSPSQNQYSAPQQNQYSAPQQNQYSAPQQNSHSAPQQTNYAPPVPNYNRRQHINPSGGLPKKRRRLPAPAAAPVSENQRSGGRYSPNPPSSLPIPEPLKQERSASSDEYESLLPHPPPKLNPARQPQRPKQYRKPDLPRRREDAGNADEEPKVEQKKKGGLQFLGLQLPELELPELPKLSLPSFFGGGKAEEKQDSTKYDIVDGVRVKSEAIPVSLGRTPPENALETRRPSAVPISRTATRQGQPNVFPSHFNTADSPVVPIERGDGPFPYGPRALNVQAIEKKRRKRRSADIGVRSGYEVVSQVDLAFTPDEEQEEVAILKGRISNDDVVYGVCLPATSFSALFVLLSLATVISVIVSGFVCYQRQLQKAAKENAPAPAGPTMVDASMVRPVNQFAFNAWFKKEGNGVVAVY